MNDGPIEWQQQTASAAGIRAVEAGEIELRHLAERRGVLDEPALAANGDAVAWSKRHASALATRVPPGRQRSSPGAPLGFRKFFR
jgi:hypothetical protein